LQQSGVLPEEITVNDFSFRRREPDCIDLFAVCRGPVAVE
jgi:hypothetical protein